MVGDSEEEGNLPKGDAFRFHEAHPEADDPVFPELALVAVVVDVLRLHEVRAQRGFELEEAFAGDAHGPVEGDGEEPVEQAVEEGDERAEEPSGGLRGRYGGGVGPQRDFHGSVG